MTSERSRATDAVRTWLDGLDQRFRAEFAQISGANHRSVRGSHREEALRAIIQGIVPSTIGVAHGQVIDSTGGISKQIDLIIYDRRFPVYLLDSQGLVPIEAVVAAGSIKSVLHAEALAESLENVRSVQQLRCAVAKEDMAQYILELQGAGLSEADAKRAVGRSIIPRTYIVGVDGISTLAGASSALSDTLKEQGVLAHEDGVPLSPSVICWNGLISVLWGDPSKFRPNDPAQKWSDAQMPLYATVETSHTIGILLAHVLWTIEQRTTLERASQTIRRFVFPYLPFESYFGEAVRDKQFAITFEPS